MRWMMTAERAACFFYLDTKLSGNCGIKSSAGKIQDPADARPTPD
jgi:hypothetical protein